MTTNAEPTLPLEARELMLRQRARLQELQARIEEHDQADNDPIAIVGMGCRFPGGASSPGAFWQILRDGVDTVTVVPRDRFDVEAVYSDDPDAADRIYTRHGAFLREDVAAFDADFFGISPREAEAIDPQQRLLLEVAWETLEHAGMAADRRARQRVGVFVGCMTQDYASLSTGYGDHRRITAYTGTGTGNCFLAGRVAYVLGFSGPALTIDTACSSSLVALHLAAQALRNGECDAALAGGVNLILSPAVSMFLCRSRALSTDGRCKTFDAAADGYGRGEGCGLVLLKRLSRAQADGDSILAIVAGSAVNHDGASAGLTVPNATAQEELLRQALESGGLRPADVDYLEAHGTGTALGDPLELAAIGAVFRDRAERPPLIVGSVKANVGHMEAAAGIAAVFKVVLSLEHRAIPKQLHFNRPSPQVPWAALPIEVPRTLTSWPSGASKRVAGVSSFGLSGTNAHVLIAEPPPTAALGGRPGPIAPPDASHVLTLSARTPHALDQLIDRVNRHLDERPDLALEEVCFTTNCGRALHEHRLAVVSDDRDTLRRRLGDAAMGQAGTFIRRGVAADLAPRVGLMFSGQGAQRMGMGRGLYARAPVFREVFDRCDAVFRKIRRRSLREICFEDGRHDVLTPTDSAQPALFAFEIALAEQWRAAGLEIDAVIGHSVGEFAAAAFAGVFTIEDGMRLVCERGRLMQSMPGGAMTAFAIDEASARDWLRASDLSLAAVNATNQVVVSGTINELARFEALAGERGVRGKRLDVSHAFHSALMDPILEEFEAAVSSVTLRPPQIRLFSNLTGGQCDAELVQSTYWRRHLREPVLFARGLTSLVKQDDETWTLLEVGPRSTLCGPASSTLGSRARAVASIASGQREYMEVLSAAAELFVQGVRLDWRALGCHALRKAPMPTYPFQRKRYWLPQAASARPPVASGSTTRRVSLEWKPLAGRGVSVADVGPFVLIGGRQSAALAATLRADGRSVFQVAVRSDGSLDGLEVLESLESATVVHLTTFDAVEAAHAEDDLDVACQLALGSLLHAAQAILRSERISHIRLSSLAPGGWDVPDHPIAMHPLAGSVHAFLASLAAEHPKLRCTSVDTSLEPDLTAISTLLQQQSGESRLALRDGVLYVGRLASSELVARPYDVRADDGAWLVTGGLGAFGRRTAAWLVERGARDLILVGRSRPSEAAEADIERMRQRGATVRVETADVSRRAEVERLLGGLNQAGVNLYGVVHAAGVLADRTVSSMQPEDLRLAMAGKAIGAQHLVDLLPPSVDVCVFYGSIAGVLGAPGQANYAAANAYLDSLAAELRRRGRRALTVDWGPIGGEGMAADPAVVRRLQTLGLKTMPPEEALAALGELLQRSDAASTVVADLDGNRLRAALAARGDTSLLESWPAALAPGRTHDDQQAASWRRRLDALPPTHRVDALVSMIQREVADVLGFDSAAAVDPRRGLQSLGMDSLSALTLRNRLEGRLDVSLPPTLVFEAPSVEEVASFVGRLLQEATVTPAEHAVASHTTGGIAIIGAACRFPSASSPEQFWNLLKDGRDAITEVPKARWDVDAWYDPDPTVPNRTVARAGGFIEHVDEFDAGLFHISPREAASLDPQQRLLLELAWEALERAGIAPDSLRNTDTGMFVGIGIGDYATLQLTAGDAALDVHTGTGSGFCFASGRLSHVFGTRGPSLSVDTACSSSLVSLHLACQSLRSGECRVALAAGVHLMLSPYLWVYLSKLGALSPRNRCATFDAEADGYVRGEGGGVAVLKRLEDAEADGDEILGVIHGSVVNHDGPSGGLTVPNGAAQEDLVRAGLSVAGIDPAQLGYVEAHGTGTPLGDPIELRALGRALGGEVPTSEPVWVGSVKANVGHLEAAAGMASLIKVLEALKHQHIPPQLHFTVPNPHVDWSALPLRVPTTLEPWPRRRPYAGISSFGLSGTNAHVIVGPPPARPAHRAAAPSDGDVENVLCLSAHTPEALRALASRYAALLTSDAPFDVAAVCRAARTRRAQLEHRLSLVIGGDSDTDRRRAAAEELERFAAGAPCARLRHGQTLGSQPGVVFLYSGQGAQRAGMGRDLYRAEPAFRSVLDRCEAVVLELRQTSLLERMFAEGSGASQLVSTLWVQPALFAFEVALAELLMLHGVRPIAVVGHSVGEIAGAVTAGVMSVEGGMRLVCARSSLMDTVPRGGAMLALGASADVAQALAEDSAVSLPVEIAAINAPNQVVYSGEEAAIACLEKRASARGIRAKHLDVSHAFHSRAMDPILDAVEAVVTGLVLAPPRIPLLSNVTGSMAQGELLTAAYWREHVRRPVRFSDQIASLRELGLRADAFVEVGPQPVLLQPVAECLGDAHGLVACSRGRAAETRELADALATLFVHGVKFERPDDDPACGPVSLPTYPFQRQRYWLDVDPPRPSAAGTRERDELLGQRVQIAGIDAVYELALDAPASDWIEEHRIQGHAVLPAAYYLAAGRRLAELVAPGEGIELRDLTIVTPLLRAAAGKLQAVVQAAGDGGWTVRFSSGPMSPNGGFREHATLHLACAPFAPSAAPIPTVAPGTATGAEDLYRMFAERGLDYGPSFRRLVEVRSHAGISIGTLAAQGESGHGHVALLDCVLQSTAGTFAEADLAGGWVPVAVQRCVLARLDEGEPLTVHARLRPKLPSRDSRVADVVLVGRDGERIGSIDGIVLQALDAGAIERWCAARQASGAAGYRTEWRSVQDLETGSFSGHWILVGAPRELSNALAAEIRRLGGEVSDIADESFPRRNDVRGIVCLHALGAPETNSAEEGLARVLEPTVELVQSLLKSGRPPGRLWLVTAGAHSDHDERAAVQASLWGLGNALTWEHPELLCTRVDVERGPVDRIVAQLVPLLAARSRENQFRVEGGCTLVPRLVRHTAGTAGVPSELIVPPSHNYRLMPARSGRLDEIALLACERLEPGPGEVEVRVHASGLNFRDVLVALGVYPGNSPVLGGECCGVVTRVGEGVAPAMLGGRVLALTPGAFSRYATVPAASIVPVPGSMSDEQAAGFPIVFLTAWYALHEVAGLQPGERVLIHAAAGGVGQAAIQIARAAGAEIWATASRAKWDLLRRSGVEHVFDSRDVNAVRAIRDHAGARGVDVVLNCLAGEFVEASLGLLRAGGRFVELGKADIHDPAEIARQYGGVRYTAFDLAALPPAILRQGFEELFGAFERGQLAPAAVQFPLEQAIELFRQMAQGAHTGKIVFVHPSARDEILIRPDRCYVVTGGAGALGRHVAARLTREGAGEIVLIGRRSPDAETAALVASWPNSRTRVSYRQSNVALRPDLERALAREEGSLPIGGVFHAAGAIDDGVFTALSWDRFERVVAPKAQGTLHLLAATRHHPVEFVVLFSSAAAVVGGAGQANYAAANAFMAALAKRGTTTTPRVLCVDWGPWAGAGMADRPQGASGGRWARLGVGRLTPEAALDFLWQALRGSAQRVCSLDVDFSAVTARLGYEPPLLADLNSSGAIPQTTERKRPSWLADLLSLAEADRPAALRPWLESTIREVLGGRTGGPLQPRQPLRDLGMDSLMSVELRNRIAAVTGLSLPMSALFEHPSLDDLCRHIARQWAAEGTMTRSSGNAVRPAAAAPEPIAIVGAACRMPGGVATLDALWRLLETSGDAIQEVPAGRWALDDWYDPDPQAPGKMYTRWMGMVDNVDQFDPGFFGISPHEAMTLDPQQRLLLELSWQALEHAGIPARGLAGTSTGVFVGISTHDYGLRHVFNRGARHVDAFCGTGSALSAAAGRISYVLGLEGPALSVDTACSSSLVALHLAAQSLRSQESNLAIVGGVNLVLAPESTVYFCRLGAMARDGRCKVFDDAADGYVRSDGCGVVVLKRLSDALRNGDRILAVVRGTAVNQDGRSNGLTAPNGAAQQAVIRAALGDARLQPDEVGYVEAHGTGTALGDAVELDALRGVFAHATRGHDLIVGSVKSNMGHLEAAAGMAGLLKAVLAVDRAKIPANVHLHSKNKNVSWDGMAAPQTLIPWPANHARRRAGVSSFGFTGTNAHLVIEQAPSDARAMERPEPPVLLIPVSARSPRALQVAATQIAGRLDGAAAPEAAALCWNAGARRSHLEYRTAVHGRNCEALVAGLREQATCLARAALHEVRPIFVFSGQGGQWRGMGRSLLRDVPEFAEALREVDTALGRWLDWSVCDLLLKDESLSRATPADVVQPLLFAMQVGLASLWRHMGVVPAAVVGHSMGEVAAACTAGALSLEDAARVIVMRSRLAARLSGSGGMMLVSGRADQIDEIVSALPHGVCVAARNSHASVVLSGDQAQIVELRGRLRVACVFTELVDVDFAAHSHHVDPLLGELGAALQGVVLSPPSIPMRSTVTLDYIVGGEGTEYWQANLRQPVQLHAALQSELGLGRNLLIEISPHPVLLQSIEQGLEGAGISDEVRAVGSMTRTGGDGALEFWRALAEAYAAGADLDWTRVSGGCYPVVDLPSTPFERRSFWIEANPSGGRPAAARGLPGARLDSAGREVLFEGELSTPVGDLAATALAGLVAAGLDVWPHPECSFHDLTVDAAIDACPVGSRVQAVVREERDGLALALFVRIRNSWEPIASARLEPRAAAGGALVDEAAMVSSEFWDEARLRRACLNRGISLDCAARVAAASVGEGLARFDLRLADGDDCVAFSCALARLVLAAPEWSAPTALDELTVRGRPRGGAARLTVSSGPGDSLRLVLDADDATWAIRMRGLMFRPASVARDPALVSDLVSTFGAELRWRPAPLSRVRAATHPAAWLVQDDGSDLARAMVERISSQGRSATLIDAHASLEEWRSRAEAARRDDGRVSVVFTAPLHPESSDGCAAPGAALIHTFLALDDADLLAPHGFHCLTRGAHAASPVPEQSALWALGRVCSLERPERWGTLVDVSVDVDVRTLVDSLLSTDDEDQLRITRRSRETLRLEPVRGVAAAVDGTALRGPVLITGGLGHLGRLLVEWLGTQGVTHVVLTSRRPVDDRADKADLTRWLKAMRQECTVDVHAVDASDGAAMRALFAGYRERHTPIGSAMHLAGESTPDPIERITRESLERGLQAKLGGARVLIECAREEGLDAVALFSSAAGTWGSAQMGAYAAANAALDALAAAHNRDGLRVCSIAWGRWRRGGLVNADLEATLARIGLEELAPDAAFAVLRYALAHSLARLTVASVDWVRFAEMYAARRARPLLSAMVPAAGERSDNGGPLFDWLRGLPRAEAIAHANREILARLARVLGAEPDQIDLDRGFLDMGLTSLLAVEVSRELTQMVGRKLPATLAFEHPTPRALASALLDRFLPGATAAAPPTFVPSQGEPAGLEHLSDELLAEKLLAGLHTLEDRLP